MRKMTQAEITAHRLRSIARDLILEAEALEASVEAELPKKRSKTGEFTYTCPLTGKKTTVKVGRMFG